MFVGNITCQTQRKVSPYRRSQHTMLTGEKPNGAIVTTQKKIFKFQVVALHHDTPKLLSIGSTRCSSSEFGLPPPQPFIRRKVSSPKPPPGPSKNDDKVEIMDWDVKTVDPYDGILEALMNRH